MKKLKKRRELILELLDASTSLKINDLIKKFNVSEVTIYRDISKLEKEGLVLKTADGIVKYNKAKSEDFFSQRLKINYNLKLNIAREAIKFIKNGDSIFLDSSTTCYILAREISKAELKNITIITNQTRIVIDFNYSHQYNVILTGGSIRTVSRSLIGPVAELFLKSINLDKAFFSDKSLDEDGNLLGPDMDETILKQLVIRNTNEVSYLMDSTKIGKSSGLCNVLNLKNINRLITDDNIQKSILNKFRNYKIAVVIVNTTEPS
jgi:DeoR family transcriptional regulator, fructose operon transcriptional repressor